MRSFLVMLLLGLAGMVGAQVTIFTENMGTGSGTMAINTNTFQNSPTYTYSGTGDTRDTQVSSGYPGASGARNVFLTNTIGKYFQIEGITTTGFTNLSLSFGAFKSTTASNLTSLVVEYSTDGSTWNTLTFPNQTGPGTAIWSLVTITGGTIPETSNLYLRWTNSSATPQFRVDDIQLTGIPDGPNVNFSSSVSASPEASGNVTVNLTISPAATQTGSVTITLGGSATYGTILPADYTTTPTPSGITITLPVNVNDVALSFDINVNDDGVIEPAEDVVCTITGVPPGAYIGSTNVHTHTILDDDAPIYEPGDIVVVGMATTLSGCADVGTPDDEVSFFCFKDIPAGASIDLTDCGYGCSGNTWSTASEGFLRLTRIGPTIPAGQVVTFRVANTGGAFSFVAPDDLWEATDLNSTYFNLGTAGDQFFFMQGGTSWDGSMANTTYDGRILSAVSYKSSPSWTAGCNTSSSDLPPGMDCLSVTLSTSSNFYKYTGDTTITTQHDWLLRIQNPTNWTTTAYATCTDYHDPLQGYDWLTAPTLRISGSTSTNVWNGSASTDWFDCSNWDGLYVPTATTDVVIDETAANNCEVGITGTNATCASVTLTSGSAATPKLTIDANKHLNVDGPVAVNRTAGSGALDLTVLGLGHLNATDLMLQSVNGTSNEARLLSNAFLSDATFTGNVTLGPGGYIDLNGSFPSSSLHIGGDFTNERDETKFNDQNSQVTFDGNGDQTISNSGFQEYFDYVFMNKPSGRLLLNDSIAIRNTLDLHSGVIYDTLPNSMVTILAAPGSAIDASNTSYVNGPVQIFGNAGYNFPIGKNGYYRPVRLQDNTATSTDAFIAEYFSANPELAIAPLVQSTPMDHISHNEYWTIERSAGNADARVVLTWDTPVSGGITVPNDMTIAHYTGGIWQDVGPCDNFGTAATGEVVTTNIQNSFSPWTLGSYTNVNPLPIELLSFTAKPDGDVVDLDWSTASERNNDHFTVERSADAEHFTEVARMPGAGNSQSILRYSALDAAPLPGHSYYRLRQTDYDGSFVLSDLVPVYLKEGRPALSVLYANDGPYARHDLAAGSLLEVRDLTGRVLARTTIATIGLTRIPVDGLSHGVYVLRLSDGERAESTRFVY